MSVPNMTAAIVFFPLAEKAFLPLLQSKILASKIQNCYRLFQRPAVLIQQLRDVVIAVYTDERNNFGPLLPQ